MLTADVLWYFALCRLCAEHVEGERVETDSCHYLPVNICMFCKNPAEIKIKLLSARSDSTSLYNQCWNGEVLCVSTDFDIKR